jgi:hypothetical protein
MDRSLKFFLGNLNGINNPNIQTGLPLEQHTIETSVNVEGETNTTSETLVVQRSLQGDNIVNYLGNSPLNNFDPILNQPEEVSDISLSSIIRWTQANHPSLQLKPEYFVYLKYFRSYPANRLMILRRFETGVPDDLFNSKFKLKPMSTLVTYIKEDEQPVKIDFNEKWKKIESDHTFFEVLQDVIGIDFSDTKGKGADFIKKTSQSPFAQDLFQKLARNIGLTSTENLYGDPNIIYEAHIRDVSGKEVSSGLESNITINFETDYSLKEIAGVDSKTAMMDIIANIMKMGTSPEKFYLGGDGAQALQGLLNEFAAGNAGEILTKTINFFKDSVDEAIKLIGDAAGAVGQAVKEAADEGTTPTVDPGSAAKRAIDTLLIPATGILKRRYNRYKWQLTGLLGTMAGSATAPWHITIGNPKSPWFSIGNLVIKKVELTPNTNFGYNDFFTELNVKITLEAARSMGSSGLTSLFNNGKGRIYDDPSTIKKKSLSEDQIIVDQENIPTTNTQPQEQIDGTDINVTENLTDFSDSDGSIDENLTV